MYLLADFGKINLKTLQKASQIKKKLKDSFVKASGLNYNQKFLIHDEIAHKAVPMDVKRYLPKPNSYKEDYGFLPIANANNQYKNITNDDNNNFIEEVVLGIHGKRSKENNNKALMIGKGLRKKKLSPTEKLMTKFDSSDFLPTNENIAKLKKGLKPSKRLQPKIKGDKPVELDESAKIRKLSDYYYYDRPDLKDKRRKQKYGV